MKSEFDDWYEKWTGSKVKCENYDVRGAWQHQQSKVDGLQKQRDSFIKAYDIEMGKNIELQKRVDASLIAFEKLKEEINELHGQCDLHLIKYLEEKSQVLEQALKGGGE